MLFNAQLLVLDGFLVLCSSFALIVVNITIVGFMLHDPIYMSPFLNLKVRLLSLESVGFHIEKRNIDYIRMR